MSDRVVSASLAMISPAPLHLLSRLKTLSASIRSVPVYLVYKYACRIMACTVFIALYDILEYLYFIVWLKLYLLKSCMAFLVYADIILCAEPDRCLSFASYYQTYVWLMDAYDPVLNGVYLVIKHMFLQGDASQSVLPALPTHCPY